MTLLSVTGLNKSYGGVPALKDVSLALPAGEVLALMGENGAGKSTLIKVLAGAVVPDAGGIGIEGRPVTIASPEEAHALGLRFIHQELNIVPSLSVAENVFLGRRYPTRLGAFVDWPGLHSQARKALDMLGLGDIDTRQTMARLSIGNRMLVKIAATFLDEGANPPRVFIMDEPTAALTGPESERLFAIIAALKAKGQGIIYVSHRMDEVMRISDRIMVLRDGGVCARLGTSATSRAEVIELMTGRGVSETQVRRAKPLSGAVALSASGVSGGLLRDISLEVRKGEILGLAGLAGAGQSQFLKLLMGHAGRGSIAIDGTKARIRQPADAWRLGLAYVPRERRAEGLVLTHDITHNTVLPHLGWLSRFGGFLNRRREWLLTGQVTGRVRLKAAGLHQRVWRLSGGNQQKVVFARAVAGSPSVLLLDEPTRGVDVGAKFDIHTLLRELAHSGTAIILASSDLPELIGLSDRIAVLRDGRMVSIVQARDIDEPKLLGLFYGEAGLADAPRP